MEGQNDYAVRDKKHLHEMLSVMHEFDNINQQQRQGTAITGKP
jgi:hypothetical protein